MTAAALNVEDSAPMRLAGATRAEIVRALTEIMGGVRSMMTYIGAAHLKEVPKRTSFVRVTAQANDVFGG